jgi:hypothetical protein
VEVKGKDLDEQQVAALVGVVKRFDVLLLTIAVDMSLQVDAEISAHKRNQADAFSRSLPNLPPHLRPDVEGVADELLALPNQLYIQAVVLFELVNRVVQAATLYYVERLPTKLGRFAWRIDAKDSSRRTEYERLWSRFILPLSQARSLEHPMTFMREADSSGFDEAYTVPLEEPPEWVRMQFPNAESPFRPIDVRRIFCGDLRFLPSHRYTGIQIADVLSNAVRRACNGTLQRPGWRDLGRLMPRAEKGEHAVHLLSFSQRPHGPPSYMPFITSCDRASKNMILLPSVLAGRSANPTSR